MTVFDNAKYSADPIYSLDEAGEFPCDKLFATYVGPKHCADITVWMRSPEQPNQIIDGFEYRLVAVK